MHKTVLTPVVIIILYNSHVTTVYVLLLSFPLLYCGIIKYMLLTISAVIFWEQVLCNMKVYLSPM